MTEQSDKHGPRLDEQIQHETHGLVTGGGPTHAEAFKDPQPVETDDGRDPTSARGAVSPGTPPGMTPEDVEQRSALARSLAGVRYPASPGTLAEHAAGEGAPDDLTEGLRQLPDREYDGLSEVVEALGIGHETRRT